MVDTHEKCIEYYDSLVQDDPQHLYCKTATYETIIIPVNLQKLYNTTALRSLLDAHAKYLGQVPNDWRQWRYMSRKVNKFCGFLSFDFDTQLHLYRISPEKPMELTVVFFYVR